MATTPSIAMIPSGYKDGKVYSVLPTNGDGDFTFERNTVATRVNSNGLIEEVESNVPRLDYSDGACPSLLLEPQSTNLITYSEDFSQWNSIDGVVVTDNFTTSPDGTQNASKLVFDGTANGRIELQVSSSGSNAQSVYLKTESGTQNVSIGSSGQELTEFTINDQWVRYTHTGGGTFPRILCSDAATIYAWGAQLEEGSYATSYIKTEGTVITRVEDVCTDSGDATVINSTEGVLYAEISALANDNTFRILSISNGTLSERIYMQYTNANNTISVVVKNGNVTQANMVYALDDATNFSKVAIKYKANDFALWVNGVERVTDASGNTPTGLNILAFNNAGGTSFYGNVKDVRVYATSLSDAELTTLTTI